MGEKSRMRARTSQRADLCAGRAFPQAQVPIAAPTSRNPSSNFRQFFPAPVNRHRPGEIDREAFPGGLRCRRPSRRAPRATPEGPRGFSLEREPGSIPLAAANSPVDLGRLAEWPNVHGPPAAGEDPFRRPPAIDGPRTAPPPVPRAGRPGSGLRRRWISPERGRHRLPGACRTSPRPFAVPFRWASSTQSTTRRN